MPIIDWLDCYSVHVKELDENHKQIIEMVNRLHDSLLNDRVDETVGIVLKDLAAYTRSHFEAEESVMKQLDFPGLSDHRRMHQEFSSRVATVLKPGTPVTVFELLAFLREKLVKHILQEDCKVGIIISHRVESVDRATPADSLAQKMPDSRSRAS